MPLLLCLLAASPTTTFLSSATTVHRRAECCGSRSLSTHMMADYPTPARIKQTANFRDAAALSRKLIESSSDGSTRKQRVAIIGGGLSGLACGKYLADAGHEPVVLEARGVLGGKVSAWQDADGDWIETGLHIFFGAYPNMMNLFEELNIEERLQWKQHRMTFAMQERPGEFTSFEFPDNVPAPFNMAAAILSNTEMLTIEEKVRMVPALLPMLTEGQSFIDRQDELSVTEFMDQYGMPRRINDEIFIAMGKALGVHGHAPSRHCPTRCGGCGLRGCTLSDHGPIG